MTHSPKFPDSPRFGSSPYFSQGFYYGGTEDHVYCVALLQIPRHTVEYACGVFSRAHCIHGPLHRLATKPFEKCGLVGRRRISRQVGRTHAAGKNTKNLNTVIYQPCSKENNRADRFAPHPMHSASYQLIGRLHWGQRQRSSSY